MAKDNKKFGVEIDGDTTGLQKSLNQAEDKLKRFSSKVGGDLGGATNSAAGGISRLSGGLIGIAGVAASAGLAVGALVLKVNNLVAELNSLSSRSGLSVTSLQQLEQAFRSTGMNAEQLADINQDMLDKMQEGFQTGKGAFVDAINDMGLSVKDYTDLLNKPDGGIQAVVRMVQEMKAMGYTAPEMKYALEAAASNASYLTGEISKYNTEADAMKNITSQNTQITEQQAEAYKKFDQNLDSLSRTGQAWLIGVLTPVVEASVKLIDAFNNDKAENTLTWWDSFYNKVDGVSGLLSSLGLMSLPPELAKLQNSIIDEQNKGSGGGVVPGGGVANVLGSAKPKTGKKSGNWEDAGAIKAAADKAAKAQEQAAAKAKAAAEKAAKAREDAERTLENTLSQISDDSNKLRLQRFDYQQKAIISTIQKTGEVLKKSQAEIDKMITQAKEAGDIARDALVNSMIGRTDPNQDLIDANGIAGSLNSDQRGFMANQQAERVGQDPTQRLLDENNERMNLELELNERLLAGTEDFEKRKSEIQAKYATQAMEIANQSAQSQLTTISDATGQIGSMMSGFFGEQSTAFKAFNAIQRGIQMAQIMMNMQVALSSAMAAPWPTSFAAYAKVAGMGAQILSTARGIGGQAHSGIEEVPGSVGKDSTWILQAGERVVSRNQNSQLQTFLDKQDSNGGSGSDGIVVNAPFYNMGGGDDAQFQEMAKKNASYINQAVRDVQKRST